MARKRRAIHGNQYIPYAGLIHFAFLVVVHLFLGGGAEEGGGGAGGEGEGILPFFLFANLQDSSSLYYISTNAI